ncbi:MAG: ComEC/Rec2 family competence protein [Clostridiales bacterium]|nr:ComEC/Rec2 family competence protein [Clostridiales bacterium]
MEPNAAATKKNPPPAPPRRPLAYIAAAYIAGIAFCYYFAPPRAALIAALLTVAALLAIAALASVAVSAGIICRYPAFPSFIFVSILAAGFLAGALYAHTSFSRTDPLELQMTNGQGYADDVVGHVLKAEQRDVDYQLLTVYADGRKLLVRVYGEKGKPMAPAPEDLVGRRVSLSGALSFPDTARNPGGFDYRLYLLSKNIRIILTCALPGDFTVLNEGPDPAGNNGVLRAEGSSAAATTLKDIPWHVLGLLAKAKAAFTKRVGSVLPEEEAALMNGMMFGDKEAMDEETYDLFKRNGVAHILSVSGLHVGMVYAFVSAALGRRKTKRFYTTVLILLLCYAALSNFSPSVMRAFSMIAVHICAMLLNRRYDMLTGIMLSAFIMLLINPLALFGIGFILSYTAVCSLSFALPFIERHTGFRDNLSGRSVHSDEMQELYGASLLTVISGYVLKAFVMSAAIQFFMLPLTAYFFNCLPLTAAFVNIPVIALASVIVPVGLVVLLLTSAGAALPQLCLVLGTATDVGASSAGALIDAMLFFTRLADKIPFGSLTVASPPLPALLLFYCFAYYLLSDAFAMNIAGLRKIAPPHVQPPGAAAVNIAGLRKVAPPRFQLHSAAAVNMAGPEDAAGSSHAPPHVQPPGVAAVNMAGPEDAAGPSHAPPGFGKRAHILLVTAMIIIASLLLAIAPTSKPSGAIYTFVDVGQGDCLHIRTADGRNYLMDGGGNFDYNVGKNVLAPYLLKNGVTKLDGVFVSHLHMDHFKGLVELAGHISTDAIYVYDGNRIDPEAVTHAFPVNKGGGNNLPGSDPQAAGGSLGGAFAPESLRYLAAGDAVLLGAFARAEVLYPPKRTEDEYMYDMANTEDENRSSLIIRFENESVSVLMTGDISKDGEQAVLMMSDPSCDILKIAHHGSKNSTSEPLLASADPEIAVIQVGRNTYGHPAPDTLETLAGSSIPVYRNDEDGAILIYPVPGGFSVLTVKRDLTSPMLLKGFEKECQNANTQRDI